jgi:hypothetical protein
MLQHGKTFKINRNLTKDIKNVGLISKIQPNLANKFKSVNHNYREGFTELEKVEQKEEEQLSDLRGKYEDALSDWETAYNNKIQSIMGNTNNNIFKGKNIVVKDEAENKYFIDGNSVYRRFLDENAWSRRGLGCPNAVSQKITQEDLKGLTPGSSLLGEIPCRKGGYNVQYGGQKGYISSNGNIHLYKDWINANATCKSLPMNDITGKDSLWANYLLNKGEDYTNNSKCEIIKAQMDNLMNANSKVIAQGEEIEKEINNLVDKRDKIDKKTGGTHVIETFKASYSCEDDNSKKCETNNKYRELKQLKKKINKMRTDINTYKSEIERQNLSVSAVQTHHLIWLIIGGAFIFTAVLNSR